ncbi:type III-A CRISPR-associated RAMP protein Csm5 [Parafilimonas terrae]|uniref:CRISPR system Cms protein Csm5 n=1 Tax=Parafilimonas terrae TaxID=1465490 RepID=A0A1I5TKG7_9BACT|nr:type III-A CRISPR-associated RAMP protein Csm5 [Parafilimonas terrae]SFP83127.1 CRISPR-associated protein, Csm5 family [Parafilimonas terrae]
MKTEALGVHMPVTIKTITPLHIGSGEVLSPLADYWMDDKKNIHLINQDAFSQLIQKKNRTNEYVKFATAIANENKTNALSNFAKTFLDEEISALSEKIIFKSFGINNPIKIDCCLQTEGKPFVPGSSLKGAIKTILLLNWLNSGEEESDNILDKFLDALNEAVVNNNTWKVEESYIHDVEEKLFGVLKGNARMPASCLRIPDTNSIELSDIVIYKVDRFNLFKAETADSSISVLKQCIPKQYAFQTSIYLDFYSVKKQEHHFAFREITSKQKLFATINKASLSVLEHEYFIMSSNKVTARLKEYDSHLGRIKSAIEESNNQKAFLRLGFGKLQFYQTIALSILKYFDYDDENREWNNYLRYCNKFKKDISSFYPVTRVLTSIGQEPLGWVELS